jgi:hypothetical protein
MHGGSGKLNDNHNEKDIVFGEKYAEVSELEAMDNILDYSIPKEILSQVFCQYLLLEDLSRFDVAICNNEKRPGYLEVIGSVACIWPGDTKR